MLITAVLVSILAWLTHSTQIVIVEERSDIFTYIYLIAKQMYESMIP